MSLINQLLQDLERRHASGSEVKGLSPRVRPLPNTRRWRTYGLLACGLAATAAAAVVLSYPNRTRPVEQGAPAPVPVLTAAEHSPAGSAPPIAVPMVTPAEQLPAVDAPEAQDDTEAVLSALTLPVFRMTQELSRLPDPQAAKATPPPVRKAAPRSETSAVPKPRTTAVARKREDPIAPSPAPTADPASLAGMEDLTLAQPATGLPVEKQMRQPTTYERAEMEFRNGVARLRQGRVSDAEMHFRSALKEDRSHSDARQALISLLIDLKRYDDAEAVLHETLAVNPKQPRHAMLLARLELERGDVGAAVKTLETVKPFAGLDAEYLSFLAAAYQREARHQEALDAYRSALAIAPNNAVWMIGVGISLQALGQPAQARDAFRAAADSRALTPELQAFVDLRIRELKLRER